MGKIILGMILAAIATAAFPVVFLAQGRTPAQQGKYERVIREIGVGDKAKVEVKRNDGSLVKGAIRSVATDSFVVAEGKTGVERSIAFADVQSAKKPRSGLKPRTWAIIGGAAAAAVIISVTVLYPVLCDGGAGC